MAAKRTPRGLIGRIAAGAFAVLLIVAFVWVVRTIMASKTTKNERKVQMVQIIQPPPPPPPPPPEQPPPPPPEKIQQELPKDEPQPTPEQQDQAPPQPLGIDAEGSAGGDAFGLAARAGGSDLIGGTGTAPYAWYTNRIKDAIQERLAAAPCAKSAKGSLSLQVHMEADGRVKQIKLLSGTGDQKVDNCIDSALAAITRMSDPPPGGMPEQINLKIVSRI